MTAEQIVVDQEPLREGDWQAVPVVMSIDVPPKAVSQGWGDMSWLHKR